MGVEGDRLLSGESPHGFKVLAYIHITKFTRAKLKRMSSQELRTILADGNARRSGVYQGDGISCPKTFDHNLAAVERELAQRDRTTASAWRDEGRIKLPPRLFFDGLLRRFMSPGSYRRYIEPHVADMHEEYFACLINKDEIGARWAVIRGHLYVVPSSLWAQLGHVLARVFGKLI